jgi:hypothetical protein
MLQVRGKHFFVTWISPRTWREGAFKGSWWFDYERDSQSLYARFAGVEITIS